ncbi:MAG: DUF3791 domain-containing protein [Prevotella sp.]|nr:DUF3791 domain-containing protein [Prevotella sp.]MDY2703941.1 DUF3791 domain-containing protein [Prevotella sp.]
MLDVLIWNKYSRVVMLLAEKLRIPPTKALGIFYNSSIFPLLKNDIYPLITMSDNYICDDIITEVKEQGL